MSPPKNAMEIFRMLDQSNCRECGKKTCLAFAGAVYTGQKKLSECPKLNIEQLSQMSGVGEDSVKIDGEGEKALQLLVDQALKTDLAAVARRIGARFTEDRLTLKIMGKDFSIDTQGNLSTDIHINPWVAVPFLSYIIQGKGLEVSGNWVSFRELAGGQERYLLFRKRCETAIKRLADRYTGLFEDIVHIFNGRQVEEQFEADISVVLYPLLRVPVMLCYWEPEDGMASSLNVFFDETVDKNLDIEAVFTLGVGLAQMFEKLTIRHGWGGAL